MVLGGVPLGQALGGVYKWRTEDDDADDDDGSQWPAGVQW